MAILKIFLYALLPLFVIGNLIRFEISNDIFINPLDAGIVVFLPFAVFFLTLHQKKVISHPLSKYALVFLATLLFSLLVNIFSVKTKELVIASLYFLRIFAYFQLIFIFSVTTDSFRKRYLKLLSFAIGVTAILGIVQYFLYNNLRNLEYLGWDVHQFRIFSTFLDPNFAGVIFTLGLFISLSYIRKKTTAKNNFYNFVISITEVIAIFLTYSRTAFVTLALTSIFYISKRMKKTYILFFFILTILGIILLPKNLKSEGVNLTRTASITARVEEYRQGISVFLKNPFFGIGFNTYGSYNRQNESKFTDHAARGIPSSYIFILTTSGIAGLSAFVCLLWGICKSSKRAKNRNLSHLLITSTLIIMIGSFFENIFFYNFVMFVYFSILGVLTARKST